MNLRRPEQNTTSLYHSDESRRDEEESAVGPTALRSPPLLFGSSGCSPAAAITARPNSSAVNLISPSCSSQSATNRYPCPTTVCKSRGWTELSSKAIRILRIAVLIL